MTTTYPENAGLPANDDGVCPSCADTGRRLCWSCLGRAGTLGYRRAHCGTCRNYGSVICSCPEGQAIAIALAAEGRVR